MLRGSVIRDGATIYFLIKLSFYVIIKLLKLNFFMSEIALFDLDDTIISGQSATLLVKYLFKKGKLNFGALIMTIIWMFFYKMSIIKDVLPAMERSYKIAKGWKVAEAQNMMKDFFESDLRNKIYPEILKIIKEHKSKNRKIAVVSNSAQILVDEVAQFLRVDYAFGTQLEVKNDVYTGGINGKPLYG